MRNAKREVISEKCWRVARAAFHALLFALCAVTAHAEDIDLFATPTQTSSPSRPNILIVIDNSANWSAANQQWAGGVKQGQSELRALRNLLATVKDNVNVGLMMFTAGSGQNKNGAYVRFHVRQMTARNRDALIELIGDDTCVDGPNSLNGTPNCIYKNFDSPVEKVGTAKLDYSAGLFDVYKYFGGYTNPANAQTGIAGSPTSATQYGPDRYSGDPDPKSDPAAYTDASKRTYVSPIDASSACTQSTIIFIGNGFPTQDSPASLLSGVGGATAQVLMPQPNGGYLMPSASDARFADEWAKFLYTTDVNGAPSQQNVATYTIDVYNAQPDTRQNALLMSMARHGGGRYFAAKSEDAILSSMKDIFIDVQSVNSVFTSASVPINATNRAQYENQVYIGMFRPDSDSRPRWYGNLKRYQVGTVNGEVKLTDKNNNTAIAASTGYIGSCAVSYWTTDTGSYWDFSASSAGLCTTSPGSTFSDAPDGPSVEKGAAAEVLRRNNDPKASNPPFAVSRTVLTCSSTSNCSSFVPFNTANVSQAALGVSTSAEQQKIVDHTLGKDVNDENINGNLTESRPSIHGDVIHSHPLPISYGGTTGVVLFYGANDGSFRAVQGDTGQELWAFVAPEHHAKLKRLTDNSPAVDYPGIPAGITPTPVKKDYFFDGTAGLYQNADNSSIWIFPTMRRGGRMIYAFDVTTPSAPTLKWRVGCPNATNDTGCTSGYDAMGFTWSTPRVAKIKGYNSGTTPVLIVGGGNDACEDADTSAPACTTSKGRRVFIIDATNGSLVASFSTARSVVADVSLVDRNGDGYVDHAYVADTGGNLYRIDFANPSTLATLSTPLWAMNKIAATTTGGRKFLFAPAVLAGKDRVYLALGSGDRERPLMTQYPYMESIRNRFYTFIDRFVAGDPIDLDGASMADFTADTACGAAMNSSQNGWYMDLATGRGEQTVTSALIFGGIVYFSTNRPLASTPGMCSANLGEARGYAVNLLNASGVVGTQAMCGAARSNVFTGGGLPPSPVTALLPVNGKATSVLFGGIHRSGGASSPIGAQQVKPALSGKRTRTYWHTHGDK